MQAMTTPSEKPRNKRNSPPPVERVSDDDGHTVILGVRMGRNRIAALDAKAKSVGMSRSDFLRWVIDVAVVNKEVTLT